ncbi:xanthine dehydrogenase family protein subunit M [Carboxydochorda subterranea]|uniref:Xanthine dehydrogenase family protein subunit M n=1 Tax=Carboxydichorda subterranea TaxID=3109565 RepID=A0ABZ1BX58_9FIRM|nr:xanthine dehydrogenase family protein subunit M [Limnochorda sp. L945t]WRP17367.1 xanthine dehydrogenase family protein subunit M [Limnochorda sp. L945t]
MYPAAVDYRRASTLEEALAILAADGSRAKVLAGGHSLLPMMKLRLSNPGLLVDIGRLPELRGIRREGDRLVIGALTTHHEVETSPLVREACPVLAEAAAEVGDMQVRNRGTVGGNLAHADPASDLPAVAVALDAELVIAGAGGRRRTAAIGDFILGPLVTALGADELLVELRVPVLAGRTGSAYVKHPHPASGYAVVGVAAVLTLGPDGTCQSARVGITGVSDRAYRASGVEQVIVGRPLDDATLRDAAAKAADGVTVNSDLYASDAYRAHLSRVYAERALRLAAQRARAAS